MKQETPDLPGFDLAAIVNKSDDIADLSDDKKYTAERLLVTHPDRYKIARGLFFEVGLSKRAICELCRLNVRTLNALIERELHSRGAEFLFEKVRRKKALIAYQLTEQLEELACDPKACKQAGINGLIQAIKLIQESTGHTIDAESSSNTSTDDPSEVDYVKVYKIADSSSNGLDSQKNLAPRVRPSDDGKTATAAGVYPSPAAVDASPCSIQQSDDYQYLQGNSASVDNNEDKFDRNSGVGDDQSVDDRPDGTPSDDLPGGRGDPGRSPGTHPVQ